MFSKPIVITPFDKITHKKQKQKNKIKNKTKKKQNKFCCEVAFQGTVLE